jgi:beta-lactamase class A
MRTFLAAVFLLATPLAAQWPGVRRDAGLERQLATLAAPFDGDVGIYVRRLDDNRGALIRPDELFPTASMIKVPILAVTFDQIAHGRYPYDTMMTWADSLRYSDEGDLFSKLQDSAQVPLSQVALWMITTSDNAAALWLQALVGGGAAINDWLSAHGFDSTRMNSRTPGRRPDWERYGWGQTTPREIAEMVVRIRQHSLVSPAADEAMYRHLTRIYWNGEALSQLPPWVQAASKQGAVDRSRSEVVLVNAPHGDYVFSVITRNQADTSWTATNAGWQLIRDVSALLWRTFEPDMPYQPPAGSERFTP